jgi:hypothetical protein
MNNRYLVTSLLSGLAGAVVVLVVQLFNLIQGSTVPANEFHVICDNHEQIEARIDSLQTRIDDMYVFAGLVVTLLLAINVGVYVKAANQVDDYLKENIERHQVELERTVKKAKDILDDLENEKMFRKNLKKHSKL